MAFDWRHLAYEEDLSIEELFLRFRDLYAGLLKHLYNNSKDIPDFRIHFSKERKELEDGEEGTGRRRSQRLPRSHCDAPVQPVHGKHDPGSFRYREF